MNVNVHEQTFFQSFHVLFSLALHENKSTTAHAHTFLSPFTCVFHLYRVETALSSLRTHRHFFSPLLAFFSYTTWASGNL